MGLRGQTAFALITVGNSSAEADVDYCLSAEIFCEYTAPGKPQQSAAAYSAIWRAVNGSHEARREVDCSHVSISPKSRSLAQMTTVCDSRLPCARPSVSTAPNAGWWSPREVFFGRLLDVQVVPLFHPDMMRADRSTKSNCRTVECFCLNNGRNYSLSTVNVLKSSAGGVCYTSDIVWMVLRMPVLLSPPSTAAGDLVGSMDAAVRTTSPWFGIICVPLSQPSQTKLSQ